jgi:hypothetical protein
MTAIDVSPHGLLSPYRLQADDILHIAPPKRK